MAKTKISEFDSNPSNNTDIDGINIAEGCAPSGINNAIRELMSQLKDQQTGASNDDFTVGGNLTVDGTSTFTGATTFDGAVVFSSTVGGLTNVTLDTPTINSPTIVFEGSTADDYETTLAVTDPTEDRTITFPDKTGTVAMTSDLPSNTSLTSGSGTYSIAGTTMTISDTSHGLTTGYQIYCNFTSGTAVDNYFTVTVVDANTFTIAYGSSLTTSGNVSWYYSPKGLINVASNAETLVGTSTSRAVTPAGLNSLKPTVLADTTYALDTEHTVSITPRSGRPIQITMNYAGIQGGNTSITLRFQWGLGSLTNSWYAINGIGVDYVVYPCPSLTTYLTPTTETSIKFKVTSTNLSSEQLHVSIIQL